MLLLAITASIILHGNVLAVDAKRHEATIHHEAFDGMPAMTMTFAVDKGSAQEPIAGDRVAAFVDESTEPWTVRIFSEYAVADDAVQPFVPPLRPGDAVPDATFSDQNGRTVTWRDFRGHATLISFIYTRCRETRMCPLVSAKFAEMQAVLPKNARLIEFTLDPTYDTAPVLARYGTMFGARNPPWTLATGDGPTLQRIALEFGVGISSRRQNTIVHGEALAIVNPDGTLRTVIDGNEWQPDEAVAEARRAQGLESSGWARFMLSVSGGLAAAARGCGAIDGDGRIRPIVLFSEVAFLLVIAFVCFELVRMLRSLPPRNREKS